jgi:hypothetical protein
MTTDFDPEAARKLADGALTWIGEELSTGEDLAMLLRAADTDKAKGGPA